MGESVSIFNNLIHKIHSSEFYDIAKLFKKDTYSSIEMRKYSSLLRSSYKDSIKKQLVDNIKLIIDNTKRNELIQCICYINGVIKSNIFEHPKICHSGKKTDYMRDYLNSCSSVKLLMDLLQCLSGYNILENKITTTPISTQNIDLQSQTQIIETHENIIQYIQKTLEIKQNEYIFLTNSKEQEVQKMNEELLKMRTKVESLKQDRLTDQKLINKLEELNQSLKNKINDYINSFGNLPNSNTTTNQVILFLFRKVLNLSNLR